MERVGRFELVELIGSGGMGDVWRARDSGIGREVALKLLKVGSPAALARFAREARLAASLDHPNIATVYEIDEKGPRPYLAMRLVEGVTLSAWKGPRRELVALMRDAAMAVQAANERGIVHRDLKPENLMIERGRVFVMDFGLAREIEDQSGLTGTGRIVGTPHFMSPEQVRGATPDPRTDVYGLGATLYAALTGRPPHQGQNLLDVMMAAIELDPPSPRSIDPTIEADLEAIVMKCLEKEPARRYPSMAALADELDRHLEGKGVSARHSSVGLRVARGVKRRWPAVAAAAVVVATVTVLTVWLNARTTGVAEARQDTLLLLRETAKTCQQAALDQRRAGNREAMKNWAGKLEAAARQMQAERPDLAEPHYLLGRMWRLLDRKEEAMAEQDAAIRKQPGFVGARYERLMLRIGLHNRRRRDVEMEERRRAGHALIGRSVDIRPVDELLAEDARALEIRRGIEEDAAAIEGHEVELEPAQAEVVAGFRLGRARDYDGMERALERATRLSSFVDEAFTELIASARRRQDTTEALEWVTRALEADPTAIDLLYDRARLLSEAGIRKEWGGEDGSELIRRALADADRAMELDPASTEARRMRAEIRVAAGAVPRLSPEKAVEFCRLAIADYETIPEKDGDWMAAASLAAAKLNLGHALLRAGQSGVSSLEASVKEFERAAAMPGAGATVWTGLGSALTNLGIAHSREGRNPREWYRRAVVSCEKGVAVDPKHDRAWMELSRARTSAAAAESPGRVQEELLRKAVDDVTHSMSLTQGAPRAEAISLRARIRGKLMTSLVTQRKDPGDLFERALEDYDSAIGTNIDPAGDLRDRGGHRVNYLRAAVEKGEDAVEIARLANEDLDKAVELAPRDAVAWEFRGNARGAMGVVLRLEGKDGDDWTRAAIESYERVKELDPSRKAAMDALIAKHRRQLGE